MEKADQMAAEEPVGALVVPHIHLLKSPEFTLLFGEGKMGEAVLMKNARPRRIPPRITVAEVGTVSLKAVETTRLEQVGVR